MYWDTGNYSIIKFCCLMITLCEEQTEIWIGPHALSLYRKEQFGHCAKHLLLCSKKESQLGLEQVESKWMNFHFSVKVAGSRRQALILLHIGYWMNIGYRPVFLVAPCRRYCSLCSHWRHPGTRVRSLRSLSHSISLAHSFLLIQVKHTDWGVGVKGWEIDRKDSESRSDWEQIVAE